MGTQPYSTNIPKDINNSEHLASSHYISSHRDFFRNFYNNGIIRNGGGIEGEPVWGEGTFAVRDVKVGEEVGERISELTPEEEPGWKVLATEEVTIPFSVLRTYAHAVWQFIFCSPIFAIDFCILL